ncbi:hypothetical protein N8K70_07520 [Microbacterium betulae]|uniref:Uncharacterized protein n=1 Tax=Microbacterium betulae TaxID=2981139 RepID=A0AA97FJN7_9MICO|nr:hypothetical protein [Microbacterium sp. AB]WOF24503.1 hypothetical protein N8K70_07520 [Microbacterium sp. AB]
MSWEDVLAGTAPVGTEPTGAYRHIRHAAEGPVAGALTACGDDLLVLAHAARLDDWEGWRHAGAQHVLAPVDLVRLVDGHAVVLPLCDVRLDGWIARRAARGPALGGGEIVTLAVSLIRGTQEAWTGRGGDEPGPVGTWWISSDARPLFAHGDGEPVETAASRAIATVAGSCADRVLRRVLDEIPAVLARPRGLHRTAPELEEKLFEACAPRALVLEGPDGGSGATSPLSDDDETAGGLVAAGGRRRGRALGELVERHLDAGVGELVADAWDGLRGSWDELRARRARGRGSPSPRANGRRAPLLVGLAAAGAVLVAGALWPEGDDGEDSGGAAASVRGAETAARPDPSETQGVAAGDGSVHRETSVEESAAGEAPHADARSPSEEETPEEAALRLVEGAEPSSTALVDDFGDVAVTRVEVGDSTQHVVLERVDGVWRVRQVYDTAKGAG